MTTTSAFKYDAFISYSHKDNDWVRGPLLLTLERNGIKIVIDYRDFEPGAPSISEMERAVRESWKTILVLTPNYINSAWSEFESIMIATLDPAGRQRRILPILLQSCDIPLRINYLTYLNFTDLTTIKLQWEKLIAAFDKKILELPSPEKKPTQQKGASTMSGISSDTLNKLRKVLMENDELSTTARLRALFTDPSLSPFKTSLPEASSVAERTDLLMDFLISRKLRSGEILMVPFLKVLLSRIPIMEDKYEKINQILESLISPEIELNIAPRNNLEKETSTANSNTNLLIWIDQEFSSFNKTQQMTLINNLAGLLRISPEKIRILQIAEGSVLVTLELPEESAQKLVNLYLNKNAVLNSLNVYRIEIKPENTLKSQASLLNNKSIERLLLLTGKYRENLLVIENRMAEFVDPRNAPPDFQIARSEIAKKIQELENEISAQITFPIGTVFKTNANEITNKDLLVRLDKLERAIVGQFDELRIGQAYIYQKIRPVDIELLNHILEEVHLGRFEQGQLQHTVDATGRALKHILDTGVKLSDPEITRSLADIYQSVNSSLSFEQQLELTLPVIPFLLEYKISLGSGVDLQAVWEELINRIRKSKS